MVSNKVSKSEVAKRFGKRALLDVAEELEIDVGDGGEHIYIIIDKISGYIAESGVPDEVSDELFDLLVILGYVDEDGNEIEVSNEVSETEKPSEVIVKPQCYGQGDESDPACKRCSILRGCWKQRLDSRKSRPCFGALYDVGDQNCRVCVEWRFCKEAMTVTSADVKAVKAEVAGKKRR